MTVPKCGSVNGCRFKVSEFVYEKACLGDSKLLYCPKLSIQFMKTPVEWQLSLEEE